MIQQRPTLIRELYLIHFVNNKYNVHVPAHGVSGPEQFSNEWYRRICL
jgi:hypothetical protein